MDFKYELNGNIKKARWKVTHHNIKFYEYSYDALNRLTNAQYGGSFILENPANGSLSYHEVYNDTYKGFNYSYDAIGNLETLSRYGFLGGPNCDAGYLDFATVRLICMTIRLYDCTTIRLVRTKNWVNRDTECFPICKFERSYSRKVV